MRFLALTAISTLTASAAFAAITSIAPIAAAAPPLGVLLAAGISVRRPTAYRLHARLLLGAFALTWFGLALLPLAWFGLALLGRTLFRLAWLALAFLTRLA